MHVDGREIAQPSAICADNHMVTLEVFEPRRTRGSAELPIGLDELDHHDA